MPLRLRRRMTVEEFLVSFDDELEHFELHDGKPLPVAGASAAEETIAGRVARAFERQLRGRPWRVMQRSGLLCVDEHEAFWPDVLVVFAEARSVGRCVFDPAIVVEVSSWETAMDDRGSKWSHYQTLAALQHYLLIATDGHRAELYSRQEEAGWTYRNYEGFKPMIQLPALDLSLLMAEIYEGVDLDVTRPR